MRHVADMVAQIAKSCQESAITHKSIMFAVERMKGLTSTVNNSAANQQQIGSDIAMSTRKMSTDIDNIKEACEEQSQWSLQIYNSLDSVTASTHSNLDAARTMEKGVEKLLAQIELLKTEIKQLQISERKA
jgi:methyl-accepting chemotaxis protein